SISELPSTSTTIPPPAAVTKTGSTWLSPRATLRWRRSSSSREAGPGISVTRWRCCGTDGPPGRVGFRLISRHYPWPAHGGRGAARRPAGRAPGHPAHQDRPDDLGPAAAAALDHPGLRAG